MTLRDKVAREVAAELGMQDEGEAFELTLNLTLAYLDQDEVDFGLIADRILDLPELNALDQCREAMHRYLDSSITAEQFASEIIGILDGKDG